MWPWAHAAFGYLCYSVWVRTRPKTTQRGWEVLVLAIGTQFPDIIDKTLAWYLHVLPYGRSLAHSLLFGGVASLIVALALTRRGHQPLGIAFLIGYVTHIIGDAYQAVLTQDWLFLGFIIWPLAPIPDDETVGVLTHLQSIEGSSFFLFGLGLTAVAIVVWLQNDRPGLALLLSHRPA